MSNKIISISVIILLISVAGGIFFWWPNLENFLNLKEKLENRELELDQKEEYFEKLDAVSDQLNNYQAELDKIDSALSADPSMPALFDFIKKSASESGLSIQSLNLGNIFSSEDKTGVKEISFNVSVSGTYPAFKNFLSVIYKNSRIIEINNINFSSPQEKDMFNFAMNLTTYSYLKEGGKEQQRE